MAEYDTSSVTLTWNSWTTNSTAAVGIVVGGTTSSTTVWNNWTDYASPTVPTPEQLEERRLRHEESARRYAESMRLRKLANERAMELLCEMLSDEQCEELKKSGYFTVISESGKHYQIKKGRQHNVYLLNDDGRRSIEYCIMPRSGDIPDEDAMLCQKLMLEHHEQDLHRIANATTLLMAA